jgi:hypothetical protein
MAELSLSLECINRSAAPSPDIGELERNAAAIPVLNITRNGDGTLNAVIIDSVLPEALADDKNGGLVKLSTGTSSGKAVADDDPRNVDMRVPKDGSVTTQKVADVAVAGTNTDGSPKVSSENTGGVDSKKMIYAPRTQTVEGAISSLYGSITSVVAALENHVGQKLGVGVHPMPTFSEEGAAPASHVGTALDQAHDPTYTSDDKGFAVTRNPNVQPGENAFAFLLRNSDGTPVAGLKHGGDLLTSNDKYPLLSAALGALFGHVSQTSHSNPHGLTLGDLGGASLEYVNDQDVQVLAAAGAYTDAAVPGVSFRTWDFSEYRIAGRWLIFRFSPNKGNACELAIGMGTVNGGQHATHSYAPPVEDYTIALPPDMAGKPVGNWRSMASAAVSGIWGMADYNTVNVSTTDNTIHIQAQENGGAWTYNANWTALAWRQNA